MKKRRNITIEDEYWEKLENKAKSEGISVSALIRQFAIKLKLK